MKVKKGGAPKNAQRYHKRKYTATGGYRGGKGTRTKYLQPEKKKGCSTSHRERNVKTFYHDSSRSTCACTHARGS